VAQRDRRLERGVRDAEALVAGLGVEREQLVLTLGLDQVQLLRHPRLERRPGRPPRHELADRPPRDHRESHLGLGARRRASRLAAQQVAERADEVARPREPACHLAAVLEREVLAGHAGQDQPAVDGALAGAQEQLPRGELAGLQRTIERIELGVFKRGDPAHVRTERRALRRG
jgi:hypothetical protein